MTRPKHAYGRPPAKGTKMRRFLLLALRPQGVTDWEVMQATGQHAHYMLPALIDHKGYDIRAFRTRERLTEARVGPLKRGATGAGRQPVIYRLVGRSRWNGTYRSFISLTGSDDEV